jgi:RNA polymerase sigma-70 factor (ECF subfamily)
MEAGVRVDDEDVRLMLAFRDGDTAAFEALFGRWASRVMRYLERMTRDTASAEELAQEVFVRVFRARESYRPEARFSTWLYRIATNVALNELRRPHRRRPHESTDQEPGVASRLAGHEPGAERVVHARRLGSAVDRALQELPERQRSALWLSAVEGLSYVEVAESLDTTEKSVKALVHRARAALVRALPEEEIA